MTSLSPLLFPTCGQSEGDRVRYTFDGRRTRMTSRYEVWLHASFGVGQITLGEPQELERVQDAAIVCVHVIYYSPRNLTSQSIYFGASAKRSFFHIWDYWATPLYRQHASTDKSQIQNRIIKIALAFFQHRRHRWYNFQPCNARFMWLQLIKITEIEYHVCRASSD